MLNGQRFIHLKHAIHPEQLQEMVFLRMLRLHGHLFDLHLRILIHFGINQSSNPYKRLLEYNSVYGQTNAREEMCCC